MKDLVSIIIPLFNAEEYVSDAINSVIHQTYSNWECIIIDDGSTDNSKTIALNFCKLDNRFKYFFQENSGPSCARNNGLRLSKGEYLLFLDADDVLFPEMIDKVLNAFKHSAENIIHYTGALLGEESNIFKTQSFSKPLNIGRNISFSEMYDKFGLEFSFIPACILFNRKSLEGIKWNEKLKHSEDWELYLNILSKDFVFQFIPKNLVIYRNSNNSLSKDFNETFKANYSILFKWVKRNNYLIFSIRCALILKNSIMKYLLRKSKKIIIPIIKINSMKILFFYILIFPYTSYYLIIEFSQVLLKRVLKRSFEV
jgi:glycosyltransferase involved in cell wall biosynthesis